MNRMTRLFLALAMAFAGAAAWPATRVEGQMPLRAPRYAITNARIVTMAGAPLDKGTLVMEGGVIEEVGAAVVAPPDAVAVDGTGLVVYPGLIDMSNSALTGGAPPGGAETGGGSAPAAARGRGGAPAPAITWADQERENRLAQLHPDVDAAELVHYTGEGPRRLAAAGITSVLAVPTQGLIRGQSALVNVVPPADPSAISAVATSRRGLSIVRQGVAQHVALASGRGGGPAYPSALLGVISFARQAFYDAAWQKEARAYAARHPDAALPAFEPLLDALAPALDRRMPVAFDANEEREIVRALGLAKEFNLDPIIVGGVEAASAVDDLKAANARVVLSANFQVGEAGGGRRGGGAGGAGGQADTPVRVLRMRQNAPKVAAALEKAGIPFAFTQGGLQNPADFIRNVARVVREGGLPEDAALRALTSGAAKIAGAAERLGTLEKGRMANVIVTDGSLFDNPQIRHVFIAGWPVDLEVTPAQTNTGRGRGVELTIVNCENPRGRLDADVRASTRVF